MTINVHQSKADGFLSHPGNPDGIGDCPAVLDVGEDWSDDGKEGMVRIEVKCRDHEAVTSDSGETSNYGWHECSLRLTLNEARDLADALRLIIEVNTREQL